MSSNEASDLLSVQLLVNGKQSNAIISKIEVEKGINEISKASIKLRDGGKKQDDFKLSNSSEFNPGNDLEIKAGYYSKEKTIFQGIISSQSISIDADTGPSLSIECRDKVIATNIIKKNANFFNCTDSEIINKVLENYPLLKDVESTNVIHQEIIQNGATDWDFIVSRAVINGFIVVIDDGKLSVKKPSLNSTPINTLNYGETIIEMNLTVGSVDMLFDIKSLDWDAPNTTLIKGTILCEGNAEIKPDTLVKIQGVSKKVNGNCYVTSINHKLEEGSWFTEIHVGLNNYENGKNL